MNFFRRHLSKAVLVMTAVIGVVGVSAQTAQADRYIVPPGTEMHLRTIVSNPLSAGGDDSSITAYLPSQYLIISKSPDLQAAIKGGYWGCDDWPVENNDPNRYCDPYTQDVPSSRRGDKVGPGGFAGQFVWEFYQLSDLTRWNGYGYGGNRTLATIGSRDKGFWGTNPAGDNEAGGLFWKSISLGAANGSDSGRFYSQNGNFPQFNGYYVFLVKQVANEDQGQGYVDQVTGMVATLNFNDPLATGCAYNGSGLYASDNNVKCPKGWRNAVAGRPTVAQNAYYIKVPDSHMITSAPTNLAFGTRYNDDNNTTNNLGRGHVVNTTGQSCTRPFDPAYRRFSVSNADMDRTSEGSATPFSPGSLVVDFPGRGAFYNTNYAANGSWPWTLPDVNDFPFSAGWSGYTSQIYLPHIGFQPDSGSAAMYFYGLNSGNNFFLGGQYFTTGPLPGCAGININPLTPKPPEANYRYNGRDAFSVTGGYVDGRLNFAFDYQITGPNAGNVGRSDWTVQIDPDGNGPAPRTNTFFGTDYFPGTAPMRRAVELQVGNLAGTNYQWVVCATAPGAFRCSNWMNFYVNKGPDASIVSPANTAGVNHNMCQPLVGRLVDSDTGQKVGARFNISWTDGQGTHSVFTRRANYTGPYKDGDGTAGSTGDPTNGQNGSTANPGGVPGTGGATFTSDEVFVDSADSTLNGAPKSVPANTTLTKYIKDNVPEGVNVSWNIRGFDVLGTADLNNTDRALANALDPPIGAQDNFGLTTSQVPTGFRWGLAASASFYRNTRPNFEGAGASTKKFYDTNGVELTRNIPDGQTVEVRTVVKNSGETPARYYDIKNYLGSTRDFARPDDRTFTIQYGSGPKQALTRDTVNTKLLSAVQVSGDQNNPDADQPVSNPDDKSTSRSTTWKQDYGNNQDPNSVLNAPELSQKAPSELAPGGTVTLSYFTRADRNRTVDPQPDDSNANYDRRLRVGDIPISDAHLFVDFQYDYCDPTLRTRQTPDFRPADVQAPFLRGGRGSIGSNQNIAGFDALGLNATFTVTANGDISHFTGNTVIESYQSGPAPCVASGKLDWRKDMVGNIAKLKSNPRNSAGNGFNADLFNPGNGNGKRGTLQGQNGNVWEHNGDLTISEATTFRGIGTIIVNGDLYVNADLAYQADNNLNSLGVIVLGNLKIASGVGKMVGSYYVLDGDGSISGPNNCPVINTSKGGVDTAYDIAATKDASKQLNVDGLIIARSFELRRYFIDLNREDQYLDAAENVYYDGRVIAATPPGFGRFRENTSWYEIAP